MVFSYSVVGSFLACLVNEKLRVKFAGSHGMGLVLRTSNLRPDMEKFCTEVRSTAYALMESRSALSVQSSSASLRSTSWSSGLYFGEVRSLVIEK